MLSGCTSPSSSPEPNHSSGGEPHRGLRPRRAHLHRARSHRNLRTHRGSSTPTYDLTSNALDGENRRVGKSVNGTLVEGLLYQDGLHAVAQLDGRGNLVARFVFGSKPNVPDYFTSSAGTFRILSDHLGSPRLVVNVSTGAVAEEIDYDEFGRVTNDTSPGLTPFGFAGGLYEPQTGLVRFGARDYDAQTGRWTSKEPRRFAGGINAYVYVANDPVNAFDANGLDPTYSQCLAMALAAASACRQQCSALFSAVCELFGSESSCYETCANLLTSETRRCSLTLPPQPHPAPPPPPPGQGGYCYGDACYASQP